MKDYGEFCASKNCDHYITWDWQFSEECAPYPCESCKLVGQSTDILEYPNDCPFIGEIKEIKLDM